MNVKSLWITLAVALIGSSAYAQLETAGDRCRAVLEMASRDYSASTWNLRSRQYLHEQMCNGEQVKSSWDFTSSFSAIIDAIPLGASVTGNSRQEKATQFCKNYQTSEATDASQSTANSTVVREAIQGWSQCIRTNENVSIAVQQSAGPEGFLVEIRQTNAPVEFQGFRSLGEGQVNCKSSVALKSSKGVQTFNASTDTKVKVPNTGTLTLTCRRVPVQLPGAKTYYPPVKVSFVTSRGALLFALPDDAAGVDYRSEWNNERTELRQTLDAQSNEISRLKSRTASATVVCEGGEHGRDLHDIGYPASCPSGFSKVDSLIKTYGGGGIGFGWLCLVCAKVND